MENRSLFQRKSFSEPTVVRMPTTLCLAPELSGKQSTVLRFNHYITLQSFASCVCHYWLYLVWKTFSCTWQFLEGIAPFGSIWRPVCFKHWEDLAVNFGSQNKYKKPLWIFFPPFFFLFFCCGQRSQLVESQLECSCSQAWLQVLRPSSHSSADCGVLTLSFGYGMGYFYNTAL